MIILVVGDFGVGKDTFADMLLDEFNGSAQKIKSYTTRKPRFEGEDTHVFVTHQFWHEQQHEYLSPIVAETQIGDDFYGTLIEQFSAIMPSEEIIYDIYIVDDIGVRDVLKANIDSVFVVEVVRPKWLIDLPPERLNRKRTDKYKYTYDFRVINDGSLEKLKDYAHEVYLWITTHN